MSSTGSLSGQRAALGRPRDEDERGTVVNDTSTTPAGPTGATTPQPSGPAARVQNLTKTYGSGQAKVVALDDVTLDLHRGEFTAVMGPSGSGKSTLMHCCAALDTATSGSVLIGDTELSKLKDKELTRLRRDQVGFVFQSFNLVPTLTAEENILLPLSIAGRKPDADWYRTVIETVGLQDRLDHRPNQLSGGQQQRVAVARALASRPSIVFADEPTGNLDSRSGAEVLTLLRRSVDEFGQTIVMVTHDPVAAAFTDRVVFLADGKVVDEIREPDRETVLDRMTRMDARQLDRLAGAQA
jgi:putative ABC transport system ATP-binding protein